MKVIRLESKELEKIFNRALYGKKRIQKRVSKIVEDVKNYGDDAVIKYVKEFDKSPLSIRQLRVKESEISRAYREIDSKFVNVLKEVRDNVTRFYKKQLKKSWRIKREDVVLGENYYPIPSVGVYIPGGTAPLVSTVYMTVIPAKLAGVKQIILMTPPDKYQRVNPYILVTANLLKIDRIYKIGGAQAIAAMAFGTRSIPKVDKVIGPGSEYVTEAKRQVFGYVDIDLIAGPSEVAIIANRYTNPDYVISDLQAQAEHRGGLAILITTCKELGKTVRNKIKDGYIIVVKNLDQAVRTANRIAPEHLQIMVQNPHKLINKITNAGAIFVGPYTPTVVGDYIAGPSHVLPTAGTARCFSGLGIDDFVKSTHIIRYSKKALETGKRSIEMLAGIEGMVKHLDSINVRFQQQTEQKQEKKKETMTEEVKIDPPKDTGAPEKRALESQDADTDSAKGGRAPEHLSTGTPKES